MDLATRRSRDCRVRYPSSETESRSWRRYWRTPTCRWRAMKTTHCSLQMNWKSSHWIRKSWDSMTSIWPRTSYRRPNTSSSMWRRSWCTSRRSLTITEGLIWAPSSILQVRKRLSLTIQTTRRSSASSSNLVRRSPNFRSANWASSPKEANLSQPKRSKSVPTANILAATHMNYGDIVVADWTFAPKSERDKRSWRRNEIQINDEMEKKVVLGRINTNLLGVKWDNDDKSTPV